MAARCVQPVVSGLAMEAVLSDYWGAVESLDADLVADRFSSYGSFYLSGSSAVQGRGAIRKAFVQLFTEVAAIRHEPVVVWSDGGIIVGEANLTIGLENGGTATIPATTVLWTTRRGIEACRLLLNPEPGLARATRGFYGMALSPASR